MYKKCKKIFDFCMALILLIIVSPILLISAIAIKLDDGGKIFFKQRRVGHAGKIFYIYKLRTMARDSKGINKVTKVGNFLRATSIDELPQLINIIKGEMSFVGPRPWIEEYSKYFTREDRRRLDVLPGISGWAQVNGRNGMSIKEKIEADIWYVDNISLKTDFIIFLRTFLIVFSRSGASITENGIQDELEELKMCYNQSCMVTENIKEKVS